MRVIIDLQCCQSGSRLGGIGRYSMELTKAMVKESPDDEFIVILNSTIPNSLNNILYEFQGLLPYENIKVFDAPGNLSYLQNQSAHLRTVEIIREQFIHSLNPDIVLIASVIEGFQEEVVTSIGRLTPSPPTVAILYDLIPLMNPELYLRDDSVRTHYFAKLCELEKADLLLAISANTMEEWLLHFKDFRGDITNIKGGADQAFRPSSLDKENLASLLSKFGINKPFLLYTASFDQRKNQESLVRAFAQLPTDLRDQYQLVFVGNGWPGVYAHLNAIAKSCGLSESNVVFTGRVEDAELVELYSACQLFVFVSLWEGFGLPVVEAMACGAPIIASYRSSLPEVLPSAAAGFDPHSIESISSKIRFALTDLDFSEYLRTAGLEHAKQFTWRNSALRAMAALRQTHERRNNLPTPRAAIAASGATDGAALAALREIGLDEDRARDVATCIAINEIETGAAWSTGLMGKVGWVTTWQKKCGIAEYSSHFISHLSTRPVIFASRDTLPGLSSDLEIVPCWDQGKHDDLVQLSEEVDARNLDVLFVQFNYGFFRFDVFSKFLIRQVDNGTSVFLTLHSTIDPPPEVSSDTLALLADALNQVAGVFVQSPNCLVRLGALGVRRNVMLLPLPVRTFGPERTSSKSGRFRIASYGFFLEGKGLPELIHAVKLLKSSGHDIELLMVNADYGDAGGSSAKLIHLCRQLIDELDLSSRVSIIEDFLSNEESIKYLRSADLIVFPQQRTSEPTSAAVRMGIASGIPVAVTPLPNFADVAPIVSTLPGLAPKDIADGIAKMKEKIINHSPDMSDLADATERLLGSHDYSRMARYLEAQIGRRSLRRCFGSTGRKD